MALRYVIKANGGTYKDKDGAEKTKYIDIGVVIDGKNGGFSLKMNAIPIGWDGWAFLAEPEARPQQNKPQARRAPPPPSDDMGDDITF